MFIVLAHARVLSLLSCVGSGVAADASLLGIVSFAAFVGSFAASHFQREIYLFCYSIPYGVDAVPIV